MFANWVAQPVASAPGTGNISLGAPSAGAVGLGDVLRDGEIFQYTVIDGDSKESGIGTYQSSGDVLIRTWPRQTLDGGVLDITNPAAINLTASAVVKITPAAEMMAPLPAGQSDYPDVFSNHIQCHSGAGNSAAMIANRQYMVPYNLPVPLDVTGIAIDVHVGFAGSVSRVGLSQLYHGEGVDGYIGEGLIDTTGLGRVVATIAIGPLKPGWYGLHFLSDSAVEVERVQGSATNWTPTKKVNSSSRWGPGQLMYADITPGWSALAAASSIIEREYNNSAINMWLTGNRI